MLDGTDLADHLVQDGGHPLVHVGRLRTAHEAGRIPVAFQQRLQLGLGDPGQNRGPGDLVAVQVQDRQHRAVAHRVQELVGMPAGGQRARLRFPVADHAADQQVGTVEGGAVGVHQRVAEFAALIDGARRLGRDVAGDAAREGELAEEPPQPLLVPADVRVDLGVGALQVDVGDQPRAAVARPGDVDSVEVLAADDPVHMHVDEVEPGCGAPVAEQARLDVLQAQRLAQQRVVQQIDLADGQVVGGPPPGVEAGQLVRAQGILAGLRTSLGSRGHDAPRAAPSAAGSSPPY
jgi:hypothetical protein